jgi:hypothetical protein
MRHSTVKVLDVDGSRCLSVADEFFRLSQFCHKDCPFLGMSSHRASLAFRRCWAELNHEAENDVLHVRQLLFWILLKIM